MFCLKKKKKKKKKKYKNTNLQMFNIIYEGPGMFVNYKHRFITWVENIVDLDYLASLEVS